MNRFIVVALLLLGFADVVLAQRGGRVRYGGVSKRAITNKVDDVYLNADGDTLEGNLDGDGQYYLTGDLQHVTVISATGDLTLTAGDSGRTFVYTGSADKLFNLPDSASTNLGIRYTFVNATTNLLKINTASGDAIDDSDTDEAYELYSGVSQVNPYPWSHVTIENTTNNWWRIVYARGAWTTTGSDATDYPVPGALCQMVIADDATQDFTGAGGFESVTNFVGEFADAGYSTNTSSITVTYAGRYWVGCPSFSFETASASDVNARLFIDGVEYTSPGGGSWGFMRTQGAASSKGVAPWGGVIDLSAGDVLTFRMDFTADETVTWDTVIFLVRRL